MLASGRGEGGSKDTRNKEITLAVAGTRHNQRLEVLKRDTGFHWILEQLRKSERTRGSVVD